MCELMAKTLFTGIYDILWYLMIALRSFITFWFDFSRQTEQETAEDQKHSKTYTKSNEWVPKRSQLAKR